MDKCVPIPCPSFETVELAIAAVCDCWGHPGVGNPSCPVHGEDIHAWIDRTQYLIDQTLGRVE